MSRAVPDDTTSYAVNLVGPTLKGKLKASSSAPKASSLEPKTSLSNSRSRGLLNLPNCVNGKLSPRSEVTFDTLQRYFSHVPEEAHEYAFGYPQEGVEAEGNSANVNDDLQVHCLLTGFFVYWSASAEVIGVIALQDVPLLDTDRGEGLSQLRGIFLDGPHDLYEKRKRLSDGGALTYRVTSAKREAEAYKVTTLDAELGREWTQWSDVTVPRLKGNTDDLHRMPNAACPVSLPYLALAACASLTGLLLASHQITTSRSSAL
eukprot:7121591-Prymnesium_polylepis.2